MAADRILVVEDEQSLRYVLSSVLGGMGCEVTCAAMAEDALALLGDEPFALAMIDIVMPGMSGLELLGILRERSPSTEVIIMTSHASIETAVDAIRKGAYDYLHKPFELDEVTATVGRALEKRRLLVQNDRLRQEQAIQNDELRQAVSRLSSLNAAGIGMSGIAELDELLDFFVGLVEAELDAERVSLMLVSEDGQALRIAAARGLSDEVMRATNIRVGEGIAGVVAREGKTLSTSDDANGAAGMTGGWPGAQGAFVSVPLAVSVPIRTAGGVLGVLNVTNRRNGLPFTQEDGAYLAALAGQAAVAIERARHSDRLVVVGESLRATQTQGEALRQAKDIAEAASWAKSEFLATVSHEIRTPLHGLMSYAHFGLKDAGSADRETLKEYFVQINDCGTHLLGLVDDVLDLTKLESGRATGRFELLELADILRPSVDAFRCLCQERNVSLTVDVPSGSCQLIGDQRQMGQVLRNVIGNAVKFASTSIRITAESNASSDGWLLHVEDDGPGIPADEREAVFESFAQSSRTNNGAGGTGLGLSISRGLVQLHGGKIWADSSPMGGAAIHIALRHQPPEAAANPPASGMPRAA